MRLSRSHTATLYSLSFLVSVISGLLIPMVPVHAFRLGASPLELGLIGGVGPAIYSSATLASGKLSGRLGRRKLVVISVAIYSAVCFLYSFASSPLHVLLVRLLEGISMGMLWPPLEALISDATPPERKRRAVSLFGLSWSSGCALGSLLSGPALMFALLETFRLAGAVSMLLALASWLLISEVHTLPLENLKLEGIHEAARREYLAWLAAWFYAFSQGIVFSLFPPYAEMIGPVSYTHLTLPTN